MQSLFFILPGENFLPTQQAHPLDNLRHVECGNDQISLPVPTGGIYSSDGYRIKAQVALYCSCMSGLFFKKYFDLYIALFDASKQLKTKRQDVSLSDIYMFGRLSLDSVLRASGRPMSAHLKKQAK